MGKGYIVRLAHGLEDISPLTLSVEDIHGCAWKMGLQICPSESLKECLDWRSWARHTHLTQDAPKTIGLLPEIKSFLEKAISTKVQALYFRETIIL